MIPLHSDGVEGFMYYRQVLFHNENGIMVLYFFFNTQSASIYLFYVCTMLAF